MDADTIEMLTDQEKVKSLTEHVGWPVVRSLILGEAAKMMNMANVNINAPLGGSVGTEIMVKQLASAAILSVLNDVQGTAEQFNLNQPLTDFAEHAYIVRPKQARPLA